MANLHEIVKLTQAAKVARFAKEYGLTLPIKPVCQGHTAPAQICAEWFYDRPGVSLVQGPRGGGKSCTRAFATHLDCMAFPGDQAKILGGSLAQAGQIYEALKMFEQKGPPQLRGAFNKIQKTEAIYTNGSKVGILAASATQVRGPHVPNLCIDEVDEVNPNLREQAIGMLMNLNGRRPSLSLTSTWHKLSGPMSELVKTVPIVRVFCIFDVLERCPDERSGPELENCPSCPIQKWCHSDRASHPQRLPKAKRSMGHYTIDSLIQKLGAMSERAFESDFLCMRPRAMGAWFSEFRRELHVKPSAEHDRGRTFHLAIDPGLHTAAVWFQVQHSYDGMPLMVTAFGDYYAEGGTPEFHARAILAKTMELTGVGTQFARVSMDPAGEQRSGTGVNIRGEYLRAGCVGQGTILEQWPTMGRGRPKADQLALVEALLKSADGSVNLAIHPRCTHLIDAFESYQRDQRDNQWLDQPKSPQHPHENLIDSITGGLQLECPGGRTPGPALYRVPASRFT